MRESTMFDHYQARADQLSRLRFLQQQQLALAAWTLQDLIGKSEFAPTPFQSKYPDPYFNINDAGGHLAGQSRLEETWFFAAYEKQWNRSPVSSTKQ